MNPARSYGELTARAARASSAQRDDGNTPVYKQLPSGRMVDLMAPKPEDVCFTGDVAPALVNLARFDGACSAAPGKPWTVMDHSVAGADILISHGASPRLALLFLLHDCHEAYTGDITTPAQNAMACYADRAFPEQGGYGAGYAIKIGLADFKRAWDEAIFAAVGVPLPDAEEKRAIREHDLRMMMTERNHMMAPPWRTWGALESLPPLKLGRAGRLSPGKPNDLITGFLTRLDKWAPNARAKAGPEAMEPFATRQARTDR